LPHPERLPLSLPSHAPKDKRLKHQTSGDFNKNPKEP